MICRIELPESEHFTGYHAIATVTAQKFKALADSINHIWRPLALDTILQTTTVELRQLLKVDRVAIFRFNSDTDWEGKFIAEDVAAGCLSIMTKQSYDPCFGEQFAVQYHQGCIQAVADIHAADLSPYHIDILDQFQVRANLVVPVVQGQYLWGLLCVHHCQFPRPWHREEVTLVKQIADHFGVAVQQAEYIITQSSSQPEVATRKTDREQAKLVEQLSGQAKRQRALTDVITCIHESLDLESTFQTTAQEVRKLLKADRIGVFFFHGEKDWEGQFIAEDHSQDVPSILAETIFLHYFGENDTSLYREGHTYVSNNIYEENLDSNYIRSLESFKIKANVVSPIMNGSELWGLLCIHQCQSPRQWQPSEIEVIQQITKHLGIALEQWERVEHLKLQASQLAYISSRERALEQQQLLSQTINAIRDSLQIEEIFDTTTQRIQSLFKTDRVVIYQFNPDWSGQFVAESVAEGWPGLIQKQGSLQDTHFMETQGGRYARQEILVIDDIDQTDHDACHLALLEDFHARAYAIVPIMEGNRLWGLLAVCQCSGPRHWETDEIDFLAQVSAQLGVALNQAEAVAQVREQASALQKATDRQRALTLTIEKIRQSLDIDVIFTTTTQEVRQLLEVDRVAIYRFNPDWSGAFVADSIVDSWQPVIPTETIIQDVFPKPDQDGQLPRNEVFVPISQGEKLWGLLMAYQTSEPRYWDDDEVGLLTQLGSHLGIALQQAELLNQTQQQTAQLNQTLQTLKSTQARLVQGEKMAGLGQLAAGIAHEINNPVGFISSNLEPMQEHVSGLLDLLCLYQRYYPEPEQVIQNKMDDIDVDFVLEDLPKIMTSMRMGTTRIVDIVKSMQTFSRVDEAAIKNVDIHQGIDSALLILKHRLKAYKHRPTINVIKAYGNLPLIQCYASHLNQVFMNILVNAIDAFDGHQNSANNFTNQVPEIQISTRWQKSRNSLLIEFSDNGVGIPNNVLDNIFNPFFTTKPVGKGTGLGLSISYQIVTEMHQGKLHCQSILGRGTTFSIEVPALISR